MMNYIDYPDREAWLNARQKTLGASEVAAVLELGFKTSLSLWLEKTGQVQKKDVEDLEKIHYGIEAEQHLRELFTLQFAKKFNVKYYPYRLYINKEYPYLTATLDGELEDLSTKEHGIWECKTVWISNKKALDDWTNNTIPQKYYIQILEQLNVTDFDFVYLTAQLIFPDDSSEIRHFRVEKKEVLEDMNYILQEAIKYHEFIINKKIPPTNLIL